jgi:hypothetical protein
MIYVERRHGCKEGKENGRNTLVIGLEGVRSLGVSLVEMRCGEFEAL